MHSRIITTAIAFVVLALAGAPAAAKVFYSQSEALDLAFPDAERVESKTHVLRDEEVARIEELSRARMPV